MARHNAGSVPPRGTEAPMKTTIWETSSEDEFSSVSPPASPQQRPNHGLPTLHEEARPKPPTRASPAAKAGATQFSDSNSEASGNASDSEDQSAPRQSVATPSPPQPRKRLSWASEVTPKTQSAGARRMSAGAAKAKVSPKAVQSPPASAKRSGVSQGSADSTRRSSASAAEGGRRLSAGSLAKTSPLPKAGAIAKRAASVTSQTVPQLSRSQSSPEQISPPPHAASNSNSDASDDEEGELPVSQSSFIGDSTALTQNMESASIASPAAQKQAARVAELEKQNEELRMELNIAKQKIDDLKEKMEEDEQRWSHQQHAWKAEWDKDRLELAIELHERSPMEREDERASLQRMVLQQVSKSRSLLESQGSELVRCSEELATENKKLADEVQWLGKALKHEQSSSQELRTELLELRQRCEQAQARGERELWRFEDAELQVAENRRLQECFQEKLEHSKAAAELQAEAHIAESQILVAQLRSELATSEAALIDAAEAKDSSKELQIALSELSMVQFEYQEAKASLASERERNRSVEVSAQGQCEMIKVCGALEQRVSSLGEQLRNWQVERAWLERMLNKDAASASNGTALSNKVDGFRSAVSLPPTATASTCVDIAKVPKASNDGLADAEARECIAKYVASRVERIAAEMEVVEGTSMRVMPSPATEAATAEVSDITGRLKQQDGDLVQRITEFNSHLLGAEIDSWARPALNGSDSPSGGGLATQHEWRSAPGPVENSAVAVGALLRQVRDLSEARQAPEEAVTSLEGGSTGKKEGDNATSQLKVLRSLERTASKLERANHEWASMLVERGQKSHEWAALLGVGDGDGASDDVLISPNKTSIDMKVEQDKDTLNASLEFTAQRLEKLRSKLDGVNVNDG